MLKSEVIVSPVDSGGHHCLNFFSNKKIQDCTTRTPLKTVGEIRCYGRINISCCLYI